MARAVSERERCVVCEKPTIVVLSCSLHTRSHTLHSRVFLSHSRIPPATSYPYMYSFSSYAYLLSQHSAEGYRTAQLGHFREAESRAAA